jgi:hypothetical protein
MPAVFALIFAASSAQKTGEPPVSKEPINSERLGIYRDFLAGYNNGSKATLNVSQITSAFSADEMDRTGCLQALRLAAPMPPALHAFPMDAFPKNAIKLVDPSTHKISDPDDGMRRGDDVDKAVDAGFAAGIFTFSEIVFDASHTHAAFSYSFHCGMLCGQGAVTIYERRGGKWRASKTQCAHWIS